MPAPRSTAPFMAHLLLCYTDASCFLCGGSLITPTVVMTAAHCLHDTPANELRRIRVRLGAFCRRVPYRAR